MGLIIYKVDKTYLSIQTNWTLMKMTNYKLVVKVTSK